MSMRNRMPKCAAFVDALREVFGVDAMNQVIRLGLRLDCEEEQRVYFCEAGEALGRQWAPDPRKVVSAAQMALAEPAAVEGVAHVGQPRHGHAARKARPG